MAKRVCELIARGLPYDSVADRLGINRDTLLEWRNHADPEFSGALKRAEAAAEDAWLESLKTEEKGWQRWAWLLERRFKDRWSRQEKVQHSGAIAGIGMPQEAAAALLRDALRELEGKEGKDDE